MIDQMTPNEDKYEILVVDDTPDSLRFLTLLLEKRGSKKRAVEYFRACVRTDPTMRWPAVLAQRRLSKRKGA